MNNGVEYILRARDMMSPVFAQASKVAGSMQQTVSRISQTASQGFNRIGQDGRRAFDKIKPAVTDLTKQNKVLDQSFDQVRKRFKDVEYAVHHSSIPADVRRVRRELEALESKNKGLSISGSGKSGGLLGMLGGAGSFKSLLGSLGLALSLGAAVSTATGFVGDSISKGLERQQIQTSFNVLAGGEQAGGALTNQLVSLTPSMGSSVFKNAQTMMGFGFDSKEVYSNLKMLGDVSMGDANKLQSLTLAFSQIKAAGRLMGQDLLQLVNAGFNPLEQMSRTTGKTIGQLKEEMEKGLIPFEAVQQAFKQATSEGGRFDNMLAKIAETPAGKMQQLSGAWDEFKVSAGTAFMPLVSMALDFASRMLPIIERVIVPLTNGVQQTANWLRQAKDDTGGWMGYLVTVRDLVGNYILPLIGKVWGYIQNAVVKIVEFVSRSELLKDIFKAVANEVKTIYTIMSWVMDYLQWQFDQIMPILEAIEKAYRLVKGAVVGGSGTMQSLTKAPTGKNPKGGGVNPSDFNPVSPTPAIPTYNPTDSIKSVASSGSRPTNINIQLNKEMVGSISIYPTTASQGVDDLGELVKRKLAEILNSSNRLAYD